MNYWEKIQFLKMYSQERCAEHYSIIYTWKILEGLVPNCGVVATNNERRDRECKLPPLKVFKCLPGSLRNKSKVSVEEFKLKIDQFLARMPDQPKIGDLAEVKIACQC